MCGNSEGSLKWHKLSKLYHFFVCKKNPAKNSLNFSSEITTCPLHCLYRLNCIKLLLLLPACLLLLFSKAVTANLIGK